MVQLPITFEEMLNERGYLVYTNVGSSMSPLLRQRKDVIEIRRKGKARCKKYDVVLYKRGNTYVLHRILEVRPSDYVIAGDHNSFKEYGITDKQILGVMTRVIRNGKSVYVDNKWYRAYVHVWCDVFPLRATILRVRKRLGAVKRAVLHKS